MKTIVATIAGIAGISYLVPASLTELSLIINKDDKEKADAIVLNAATEYFKQQRLIAIRAKVAEALEKKFEIKPKLYIGKIEVIQTVDKDGKVNGFKAVEGKKTFNAEEKPTSESAKDFIDRVIKEKEIKEDTIRKIVQKVADENPFTAEQKRVRGSVASKPVGKKWITLAEKIIKAGNGEKSVAKLKADSKIEVDISGDDKVKRLAMGLAEQARKALEALETEQGEFTGTDENPLVVDGTAKA